MPGRRREDGADADTSELPVTSELPTTSGAAGADPAPTELLAPTAPDDPTTATSEDLDQVLAAGETAPAHRGRGQDWRRMFRGNRALWVTAIVAVVCLVAGLLLGRFVISPSQAAADAEAPEPGLITVPVEERELTNDVVIRGDVGFADSVEARVETADLGGPAVVTGAVPEVGAELNALTVALEVAGRPVIVLPGDLPVYRSLRVGVSGPDVLQLKAALVAAGINPGDPASNLFDAATASAIRELYAQVGYPLPDAAEGSAESVSAAEESLAAAQSGVNAAQSALNTAAAGPSAAERREQDNLVNAASRALAAARAADPQDPLQIAELQDAYELAVLQRTEALAAPDTSAERQALNDAIKQRDDAQQALAAAQTEALPFLPASEVLYLSNLPRRVDEVMVQRGGLIDGVVMRVSGATLEISGAASASDAQLLEVGATATFELPDGGTGTATVVRVGGESETPAEGEEGGDNSTSDGRTPVVLAPVDLTPEALQQLQGSNIRVSIPVSSTDGEVLAVPIAALTAGPGGESRVEIVTGPGEETELVEVTTGLAAEGFVEVTAVDGSLEVGDRVVVGR